MKRRLATKLLIQKKMLTADEKTTFNLKGIYEIVQLLFLIYKKVLGKILKTLVGWIYKNMNLWLNFSWNLLCISGLFWHFGIMF